MSLWFLAALLAGSGAAALVYETLWVKQLALVVGVDVYAVTTVVSAFFAGLALGSAFFGARADRTDTPLALYGRLELVVALLAPLVSFLLSELPLPYARLTRMVGGAAWLVPFVLIALPAFLMGGTLPAMVRAAARSAGTIASATGVLYAANTLGGVVGALALPLWLVPTFGIRATSWCAAALNASIGVIALGRSTPAPRQAASRAGPGVGFALVLYALAGAVALGLEIAWTEVVVQFLNTRAYAFALVLAVYLLGLVAGSILYARWADRVRRPWLAFGVLELAAAASTVGTFVWLGPWLPAAQANLAARVAALTGASNLGFSASLLLPPFVLLFLPTVFQGAAFPAAARLVAGPSHAGRDVGLVTAVNTLGGIAGTWLTGFVAIPGLGVVHTVGVLAVVGALLGVVACARGQGWRPAAAVALAIGAVAFNLRRDHLAEMLATLHGGKLLAFDEGPGGTVAITTEPFQGHTYHRLYIQGVSNSGDNMLSQRYMRLQTLLPLLIHRGTPRAALVIGLGTGITCGTLLTFPDLQQRTCVELLPAVRRSVRYFDGNFDVGSDPRVDIRLADGRRFLLLNDARYDLITAEPPPPTATGVVNLYSRDFYQLCAARLAPQGIVAQWLPLTTQNDQESRALVRSFIDVFPYAQLWTTELHETLLVGSRDPLPLNAAAIAARFQQPSVQQALAAVGVPDVETLLATFLMDRDALVAYAGTTTAVTDNNPHIEYAPLLQPDDFPHLAETLLALRHDPPLTGLDADATARMIAARERLHTFYQASLLAIRGRHAEVEPLLQRVFRDQPDNPYYRYFVGG